MKNKIEVYIKSWERKGYKKGIPDEAPIELEQLCKVPSYRKIAYAILKNDHSLKSLGFAPKKSEYYTILKGIEIAARNKTTAKPIQLKLF